MLTYQEYESDNGIYVIEKRLGLWMLWKPNNDSPAFIHEK